MKRRDAANGLQTRPGDEGAGGRTLAWEGVVEPPLPGRQAKPRRYGVTMVLDRGLPLPAFEGLLQVASPFVDFWKLAFGTSALLGREALEERVELARRYGVELYPGGTLLEVALHQGRLGPWIERALALGLRTVELSDGTIPLALEERRRVLRRLRQEGFTVITEVGKKHPDDRPEPSVLIRTLQSDLDEGAAWVIVEGRESGQRVGIYREDGSIDAGLLDALVEAAGGPERILWEAPRKSQQEELLRRLGVNVNLGNLDPSGVLALEALRLGLRGDTLRPVVRGG